MKRTPPRMTRHGVAGLAGLTAIALLATGCSAGGGGTSASGGSTATSGVTITVALPADTAPPAAALTAFTDQTGIKVDWVISDWDSLQTKISAAATANTYFADVTNVDWSRVGQLGKLKWFQPLEKYLDVNALKADMPQLGSFTLDGHLIGVPYDSSYMVTTVNTELFAKAGITTMPTTMDEYTNDLKQIKAKGVVEFPLNIPFAAAEGLSTYWYETTNAFGGTVLDAKGKPQFTDPSSAGYKAAQWMVDAIKGGLVPPGNINVNDGQGEQTLMAQGMAASTLSDYSGLINSLYNVTDSSKVAGKIQYLPTPGVDGPAGNLSNPDGMGIPTQAKYPAAAAKFIEWFNSASTQEDFAGLNGQDKVWGSSFIPSRVSVVEKLAQAGSLADGEHLAAMLKTASPVFPEGAPTWYPTFSNAVYTNLHAAATGSMSVADAISAIAAVANQQASNG
jgi:multiple sugar transport system substrate-binding protein